MALSVENQTLPEIITVIYLKSSEFEKRYLRKGYQYNNTSNQLSTHKNTRCQIVRNQKNYCKFKRTIVCFKAKKSDVS